MSRERAELDRRLLAGEIRWDDYAREVIDLEVEESREFREQGAPQTSPEDRPPLPRPEPTPVPMGGKGGPCGPELPSRHGDPPVSMSGADRPEVGRG